MGYLHTPLRFICTKGACQTDGFFVCFGFCFWVFGDSVIFSPTVGTSRDLRAAWQSRWALYRRGSEGSLPLSLSLPLSQPAATYPAPAPLFPAASSFFFSVPSAVEPGLPVEPRALEVPGFPCLSRAAGVFQRLPVPRHARRSSLGALPDPSASASASAPAPPGCPERPRPGGSAPNWGRSGRRCFGGAVGRICLCSLNSKSLRAFLLSPTPNRTGNSSVFPKATKGGARKSQPRRANSENTKLQGRGAGMEGFSRTSKSLGFSRDSRLP